MPPNFVGRTIWSDCQWRGGTEDVTQKAFLCPFTYISGNLKWANLVSERKWVGGRRRTDKDSGRSSRSTTTSPWNDETGAVRPEGWVCPYKPPQTRKFFIFLATTSGFASLSRITGQSSRTRLIGKSWRGKLYPLPWRKGVEKRSTPPLGTQRLFIAIERVTVELWNTHLCLLRECPCFTSLAPLLRYFFPYSLPI